MIIFFVFLFGLCWGSFLNMIGYRLVSGDLLLGWRSFCPTCKSILAWFDMIPIFSWAFLRGKCRMCRVPISWLYPFIELITALIVTGLFYYYFLSGIFIFVSMSWLILSFISHLLFFTALIVATRTDLHDMVIFQGSTLFVIPFGFLASFFGLTRITLIESVIGVIFGYGVLWMIGIIFKIVMKREGIGHGDFEILALIGAFLGLWGVWFSLMLASIVGLFVTGAYLWLSGKSRSTRIPFVPFLALGATLFFFFQDQLMNFFL
jgi:leader peptidase (prepilin peptidase)/N-methyltransferase